MNLTRYSVECAACGTTFLYVVEGPNDDVEAAKTAELRACGFGVSDNGIVDCPDCTPFRERA